MKKTDLRFRIWLWWAAKIVKIPYKVDFDLPDDTELYAVGFAWSEEAANRVRGNDALIEQIQEARTAAVAASGSRTGRRIMNRAARRAAKEAQK